MAENDSTGDSSAHQRDGSATVSLTGEGARASVARSVAETLALLYDFGLDDVADVKMAVDEACSQLEVVAAGPGVAAVRLDVRRHAMRVTTSADVASPGGVDQSGFGWHVLRTLTDRVEVGSSDDGEGAGTTSITFDKVARAAA